nr:hypothetical protein [Candidatus Krumholzibacteria bacterium]
MRSVYLALLFVMTFLVAQSPAITLKEAYEAAPAANGYDRYVELENGVTYTGGLLVGRVFSPVSNRFIMEEEGADVRIVGNGAVLDLQGEQICLSYCDNRMDISDCIIINGNIRFRGDNDPGLSIRPTGSVKFVTFYQAHDYGVRLQGAGQGITVERNLIIDTQDTGLDYIPTNGVAGDLIPTGTAIAASVQTGDYGLPDVRDNWTYYGDPDLNPIPLHHYSFL